MDLLGDGGFDLSGDWAIYSRHLERPPHFIDINASVKNSIVSEGAVIFGTVESSVIFSGVKIMKNAVVRDSVVMADVVIGENSIVNYSILDELCYVGKNMTVGTKKDKGVDITVTQRESILENK
jgi:glucose-1-phosphate adenylyltransferase